MKVMVTMQMNCNQHPEEDLQPILREEVEIAVLSSPEKGASVGVENKPAELVQACREIRIDV